MQFSGRSDLFGLFGLFGRLFSQRVQVVLFVVDGFLDHFAGRELRLVVAAHDRVVLEQRRLARRLKELAVVVSRRCCPRFMALPRFVGFMASAPLTQRHIAVTLVRLTVIVAILAVGRREDVQRLFGFRRESPHVRLEFLRGGLPEGALETGRGIVERSGTPAVHFQERQRGPAVGFIYHWLLYIAVQLSTIYVGKHVLGVYQRFRLVQLFNLFDRVAVATEGRTGIARVALRARGAVRATRATGIVVARATRAARTLAQLSPLATPHHIILVAQQRVVIVAFLPAQQR